MFKNKNKESGNTQSNSANTAISGSSNSIVAGTSIEGTVKANNDIRIDGTLKGVLDCKGRVIIGPDGFVEGEVTCQNAVVEGRFSGTLKVSELLNVREGANIQGDVDTGKLNVQPGAVYNVKSIMGGQKVKSIDQKKPA